MTASLGEPNAIAIAFFLVFIVLSLGITVWAARQDADDRSVLHGRAAASPRCRTAWRWPATT